MFSSVRSYSPAQTSNTFTFSNPALTPTNCILQEGQRIFRFRRSLAINIHVVSNKVKCRFQETQTVEREVKQYIADRGIGFQNYYLQYDAVADVSEFIITATC